MADKIKSFEEAVKNRAKERVNKRIRKFKDALYRLLETLTATGSYSWPFKQEHRDILTIMASEDASAGWPPALWEREELAVRTELFGVMDEMQKALLAKPPEGEDVCTPA